jgi:GNAT superfamily N-acetyltransferase
MPFLVRAYDPGRDHGALRRCFIELQDHEHSFYPEAPTGAQLVDESGPFMLARLGDPADRVFVAEADGVVVGFATVRRVDRPEPDDPDPFFFELSEISVTASARGQRIGTGLIDAAERHAREQGSPSLRVRMNTDNPDAGRLYARLGFRPVVVTLEKDLRR